MKLKELAALLIVVLLTNSCKDETTGTSPEQQPEIVEYREDQTIFSNPERGMYIHKQFDNSGAQAIRTTELIPQRNILGYSLVLTIYYLGEFMDGPINDQMFQLIRENMNVIRESGFKAILRFAYSQSENAPVYDAPEEVTLNHITQLAPIIRENSDVIAVFQAGFIGAWGEWWYSTYYGNENAPDYNKRKKITDALLQIIPDDRMISVRTPQHKTGLLDISFRDSLTVAEARNGNDKSRLGHHNDCFLADANDMGTYVSAQSRSYTATDSKYTCMGGETCAPSSYAECAKAIEAMETYHWSYLNKDYNNLVLSDWRQKGCFDEIQRRLGYRFVIRKAEHPEILKQGEACPIKLTIENTGFAAPYHLRVLEILFRDSNGQIAYRHRLENDIRFWFGGETIVISETINLPSSLKGSYDILLFVSDPAETLKNRPEYAIRFANQNVWEEETGYNNLFKQQIQSGN